MATKKASAKKPAARKSGRTAAKRGVTAKARKPAARPSSSRRAAGAKKPPPGFFSGFSLPRMLADIFGMKH